jgi:hypothetical protein
VENRGEDGGFYSEPGQRRGVRFLLEIFRDVHRQAVRRCYLIVDLDVILVKILTLIMSFLYFLELF